MRYLNYFLDITEVYSQWLWLLFCCGVMLRILLGSASSSRMGRGVSSRSGGETEGLVSIVRQILNSLLVMIIIWFGIHVWVSYAAGLSLKRDGSLQVINTYRSGLPLAILLGVGLRISWLRFLIPYGSRWKRLLRVEQLVDKASDIRDEYQQLKPKAFDPQSFYAEERIFYGLDEHGDIVFDTLSQWKSCNQKIIGPTQVGKGVHLGVQVDQCIRKGLGAVVIDPKPDKHLETIMKRACDQSGRMLIVLDFRPEGVGSWSPFLGGSERERRSRLLYAFGLNDTGGDSDFYKLQERAILDELCIEWDGSLKQLNQRLREHPKVHEAPRIKAILSEWMQLERLNPKKGRGFSLERSLIENAVVYVRASLDDRLLLHVMSVFLMEVMQLLKSTYRHNTRTHHVCIIVDEVRFMVSDLLADALATIVGFNANIILAYQSVKDLRAVKSSQIDVDSLEASINTNCKVTLCYAAINHETAQWIAELSGTVQKQVARSETIMTNSAGAEVWNDQRTVAMIEEYAISPNKVKALPERVGVLLRPNRSAETIFTSWVRIVEERLPSIGEKQED